MAGPVETGPGEPGRSGFELRYTLESRDFEAMYAAQAKAMRDAASGGRRLGWPGKLAYFAAVFVLTLAYLRLRDTGMLPALPLLPFFLGALAAAAGFYGWWALYYRPRYMRSLARMNALDGVPIVTAVDREGLRASTPDSSAVYRWPAVRRIDRTQDQFVFWLSEFMAVIVPKRAFARPDEAEAFAAAVKEWSGDKTA